MITNNTTDAGYYKHLSKRLRNILYFYIYVYICTYIFIYICIYIFILRFIGLFAMLLIL